MKISVFGAGAYGLALSLALAKNGHDVIIWTENLNKELEYKETKSLKSVLNVDLPNNIKISSSYE